jgi:MFS family permease
VLAANLATAFVTGVAAFTILQATGRAASAAVASLAVVYLAEELTPAIRSFGMGVYSVAGSLAGGSAFLLAPLFGTDHGRDAWRWLFGLSAIGIIVLPLLIRFLRESRAFPPVETQRRTTTGPIRLGGRFWPLAGISFMVGAFVAPAVSFAFDHLVNDLAWTERAASLTIISAGAVGATGLFIGGRAADRWGRRPTVVLSIVVGVVGGFGFYWMEGPILAVWIAIASFGSSAFVPAFSAHRSELFPTGVRASAIAWLNVASVVGAIASLAVGYVTIDEYGLPWTVTVLGILALASALLVRWLPETKGAVLSPAASLPGADTSRPVPPLSRRSAPPSPTTPRPGPTQTATRQPAPRPQPQPHPSSPEPET